MIDKWLVDIIFLIQLISMYSNYLTEIGKLVFIIGEIQTTSSFKKMLDVDLKTKYFFKCVDELPVNSYKKIKVQYIRKGILRVDWFNKILDRSPMMIFMVFNLTAPLDKNQKWEDRLSTTIRKINKVVDILRSSNKEDTILRIVVIISKESVLQSKDSNNFNILQKINSYLKNYERDLSIFQSDLLVKEINKNRPSWFLLLDKAYERKHRAISKRKQESFSEKKIGCMVKMAIISQVINKKESYFQYDEALKALHNRFNDLMKGRIDPSNFGPIQQVRAIADIVFLRLLIVKINLSPNYISIPDMINRHLKSFTQKECPHYFFEYENIIWRENFIQNLLELTHLYDHIEFIPNHFFCQLVNGSIDLSYRLASSQHSLKQKLSQSEIKGRLIPIQQPAYIGLKNYSMGVEITDIDIIWTEITDLMEKKKDYISKGMQNISRYKAMKIFKKNEILFLNTYLMKFYIMDEKYGSADAISKILAVKKLRNHDYYYLNGIIKQIAEQPNRSIQQLIKINGIGTLLSDYFRNFSDLQKFTKLFISQCKKLKSKDTVDLLGDQSQNQIEVDPDFSLVLPLQSSSHLFNIQTFLPTNLHSIEQQLEIRIFYSTKMLPTLLSLNSPFIANIEFNHKSLNEQRQITLEETGVISMKINPLQYFNHDETIYIKYVTLTVKYYPFVKFHVQNFTHRKYQNLTFYTKLQLPKLEINIPYETYFLNQVSKFTIEIGELDESIKIDATFTVDEEEPTDKTEIYVDYSNKMNLTNSKRSSPLSPKKPNIVFMKCNNEGHKLLKFRFVIVISHKIGDKTLVNSFNVTKEIAFKVSKLFRTLKILKEAFTGNQLKISQVPPNKKIVLSYCLRSAQTINILELGQHKSPKQSIKFLKQLPPIENMIINPEQKMKNVVIFEVVEDLLSEEQAANQIFIMNFYIKWNRIDMDMKLGITEEHSCDNVYIEEQLKINLKCDQIQVEYEEGIVLNKLQKQTLSIKYRNLTNKQIIVYARMDNSEAILRVGSKSMTMNLGPKQTKPLTFEILPIKSGYHSYPNTRNFFDGIQATEKTYKNYLCII